MTPGTQLIIQSTWHGEYISALFKRIGGSYSGPAARCSLNHYTRMAEARNNAITCWEIPWHRLGCQGKNTHNGAARAQNIRKERYIFPRIGSEQPRSQYHYGSTFIIDCRTVRHRICANRSTTDNGICIFDEWWHELI